MNSEASFSFRCAGALPDVDPEDGPTELELQIQKVKRLRVEHAARNDVLVASREVWEHEHIDLINEIQDGRRVLSDEETKLRELTPAAYATTGDKKPALGVGIRVSTVMKYDEAAAKEWALMEGHIFLSLDTISFEGWLKTMQKQGKELPVQVEEIEKPTATIARDL